MLYTFSLSIDLAIIIPLREEEAKEIINPRKVKVDNAVFLKLI